jgi:myo-inositol-1(or 4)-monophosphatase
MRSFEEAAIEIAVRAGDVLRRRLGHTAEVHHKGAVDLVTAADREAEALILNELASRFPDHGIVAEESGEHVGGAGFVWYVDPLDGTTNFVHGLPHFAVSMALVADDALVAGVVHDPMRHETFHASRGHGAFLNGERMTVSPVRTLQEALVATGFPYYRGRSIARHVPAFGRVLRRTQGVRRAGAAALDLAYVACGRFDGYWEARLQPWDTAAGSLLVRESGGRVTDYHGVQPVIADREILATNGLVHDELRAVILNTRLVDGSTGL